MLKFFDDKSGINIFDQTEEDCVDAYEWVSGSSFDNADLDEQIEKIKLFNSKCRKRDIDRDFSIYDGPSTECINELASCSRGK